MKKTGRILVSDFCGLVGVDPLAVVMARARFQEVVSNPISSRGTRTRCVFTLDITAPLCLFTANQAPPPSVPLQMSSGRAAPLLALSTARINFKFCVRVTSSVAPVLTVSTPSKGRLMRAAPSLIDVFTGISSLQTSFSARFFKLRSEKQINQSEQDTCM